MQTVFLDWSDNRIGTWDSNPFVWEFVAITIPDTIQPQGGTYQQSTARKKRKQTVELITFIEDERIVQIKEINNTPDLFIEDAKFVEKQGIKLEIKL